MGFAMPKRAAMDDPHISERLRERRSARAQSAFTLIELLVVMIIISILMAVAVPTFLSEKNRAVKSQILQNFDHFKNAIESCSTKNTDGSYTGCTEVYYLDAPELKDLPKCCPGGPRKTGEYDLNGVAGGDAIIWAPTPTQVLFGYELDAYMQDGDKDIWFQLGHWTDGTVTRKCGLGNRPTSFTKVDDTSGVPGSRVCATGKW